MEHSQKQFKLENEEKKNIGARFNMGITRQYWYEQIFILLEIVKQLGNKEGVFIEKQDGTIVDRKPKVIRCINAGTIDYLKKNFEAFRFLKFPNFNIYFSLANYDRMPQFSFSPVERAKQYVEWSNGQYLEKAVGYDWAIDIDSETWQEGLKDILKIKVLFDRYNLPASYKWSGQKGFHILIEYRWLPQLPFQRLVVMLSELTTMIKEIDGITNIDDSIIDERRVIKAGYTWDRGKITLPLDDYQLANFDPIMVQPEWVLKNIQIKGRGMLTRHTDQPEPQARASFLKMAENFIDIKSYLK